MIKFDLRQLSKISKTHSINVKEIRALAKKLPKIIEKTKDQAFFQILKDQKLPRTIESFVKKQSKQFKSFVLLGIGGSALGAKSIRDALENSFTNRQKSTTADLYIIDNIDPEQINELQKTVNLNTTLFIVISKSGGTIETISQYLYFRDKINKAKLAANKHFVFVTDAKSGLLRKIAEQDKIPAFSIPNELGGRFAVLSAVGLLPSALIGTKIKEMLKGAREMSKICLSKSPEKNLAFQLATTQYLLEKKGKHINILMPYCHKLNSFTDWYGQLLSESIGKKGLGITPVKAIGATDQHSQIQLYNDGPNNKLIIFLEEKIKKNSLPIPNPHKNFPALKHFNKKLSFAELITLEKKGTEASFTQNQRPNISIEIEKIDAYNLGELFIFFEASIAYLAQLYGINAFDQPGVELGKKITQELLAKK